jgi:erythromycin esterase-like protein
MRWQFQLGEVQRVRNAIGKRLVEEIGFHE